jgi:hypothetical protein
MGLFSGLKQLLPGRAIRVPEDLCQTSRWFIWGESAGRMPNGEPPAVVARNRALRRRPTLLCSRPAQPRTIAAGQEECVSHQSDVEIKHIPVCRRGTGLVRLLAEVAVDVDEDLRGIRYKHAYRATGAGRDDRGVGYYLALKRIEGGYDRLRRRGGPRGEITKG